MRMMSEEQIPDFVRDVAETGCDITAVLGVGYVIGDSDLPLEAYERIAPRLKEINEIYGDRDHLFPKITEYLISIGRFYPKERKLKGLLN